MAERKENSVLFTLKELKDITADEEAQAPAPVAAAPRKRRTSSAFTDDADSLLADIRDAVGADATAEARQLEAERGQAANRASEQIMATQAAERAEIDARIAAERARRSAAADERDARLHAADIAERRARGEIIEEPVAPAAPVQVVAPIPAAPAPPATGQGTSSYLWVVGLSMVCLTAVAIVLILKPGEQAPPAAAAAAAAPAPPATVQVPIVAPPPPEPEPENPIAEMAKPDAGPDAAAVASTGKKKGKKRGGKRGKKRPTTAEKKKKKLKLNLGGGKGGITF